MEQEIDLTMYIGLKKKRDTLIEDLREKIYFLHNSYYFLDFILKSKKYKSKTISFLHRKLF